MYMKKVAVVTCYKQPDYVRAVVLRQAIAKIPGTKLYVVKNTRLSILRYFEVLWSVAKLRVRANPDTYIITFRGYEILPFMRLLCLGKQLVYDELVNPIAWATREHNKVSSTGVLSWLGRQLYKLTLAGNVQILADTPQHAAYSAKVTGLPLGRFTVVPVGTDEATFKLPTKKQTVSRSGFKVFYYGNMLPLHGIGYVCQAAEILAKRGKDIEFVLVGGGVETEQTIKQSVEKGALITYERWVDYKKLTNYIYQSSVCLGGPFGVTEQSAVVVTGKAYQFIACGAPTVVGEIPDQTLFKDKDNCLLVKRGSAKSIADALLWAYEHPKQLQLIGQSGRKLYEKHFTSSQIAKILEPLI